MRGVFVWAAFLLGLGACQCGAPVDPSATSCLSDDDCASDQRCAEAGLCEPREGCQNDADCLADERCDRVDGACELRAFFARDCSVDSDCYPGFFCALGACRDSQEALSCADAYDCPTGYRCDRLHYYCIQDVPCVLASDFPEVACDPGQSCDPSSGACSASGAAECSSEDQALTCEPDELCDSSGRCVQCTVDAHCGPGLRCNVRAGRCESQDLCHSDDDCTPPLICDPVVALCRVPLPPCDSDLDCALAEFCNRVSGLCESLQGSCVDDRLEENDSPGGAYLVNLGSDQQVLDSLQLCPDDDDFFALELSRGQGLSASLQDTVANAEAELLAYDSDGVSLLTQAYAAPRGDGQLNFVAEHDGRYFLRALARPAPSPYQLVIQRSEQVACAPDVFDAATPNNTADQAVSLTAGHYPNLSLCADDADFFAFDLVAGEALKLDVDADDAGLDPDIQLYQGSTATLLAQASAAGSSESIRLRVVDDTTLVARIKAYAAGVGGYALQVDFEPPFVCMPDAYDAVAENNSAAHASAVSSLDGIDLTLCAADQDCFVMPLEYFARSLVQARYQAQDLALRLRAYLDPEAEPVATSAWGQGLETVVVDAPQSLAVGASAPLWICVDSIDGALGPYQLSFKAQAQDQCRVDDDEPNDQSAQASLAPSQAQRDLCGFDQDFFRVPLQTGKTLDAAIHFLPAQGDLDLQLIHPDGHTVLLASDGVSDSETLHYRAELDGDYFLRVYSLAEVHATYLFFLEVDGE